MKLEEIGFPAMSDERAENVNEFSNLSRCELIITDVCNLSCLYCNGLSKEYGKPISLERAEYIVDQWASHKLQHASFSGGEPMCSPHIFRLVERLKKNEVPYISLSTNGTFPYESYERLVNLGATHFSISIDGKDSEIADKMAGVKGAWKKAIENIERLSKISYVTASTVIGIDNWKEAPEIIEFIHSLGVADIRFSTATQYNKIVPTFARIPQEILLNHPILKFRVNRIIEGKSMRGANTTKNCWLPLDDMVVSNNYHFPCTMQMREGGQYIGTLTNEDGSNKSMKTIRKERANWCNNHNCFEDKICQKYCMDFIIAHNEKVQERF